MVNRLDAEGSINTFVIQPNPSMSWHSLIAVYLFIAAVTIGVGVFCFANGLPLVLPFSGLEVVLLGAALYITAYRGGLREVITISHDRLAVESGHTAPERRDEFERPWTRVELQRSRNGWYPSRLLIRSHGRQVEVGRFLNEQERRGLAQQLAAAVTRAGTTHTFN